MVQFIFHIDNGCPKSLEPKGCPKKSQGIVFKTGVNNQKYKCDQKILK